MNPVKLPFDLLATLRDLPIVEAVRAMAELPMALEANMRETNALIKAMNKQIAAMTDITSRLLDATAPMALMAEAAKSQMELTTTALSATNINLERIVEIAGPLDRTMKRMAERFSRDKPDRP